MALSIIFMLIMLQSLSPLLTPIQTHIYLYFHLVSLAFHIYNDQQIQTNETIKTNKQRQPCCFHFLLKLFIPGLVTELEL